MGFFVAEPQEVVDEAAAENVRRVTTGNVSVEGHSLADLQEWADRQSARTTPAASKPHRGLRFSKMIPPGGGG